MKNRVSPPESLSPPAGQSSALKGPGNHSRCRHRACVSSALPHPPLPRPHQPRTPTTSCSRSENRRLRGRATDILDFAAALAPFAVCDTPFASAPSRLTLLLSPALPALCECVPEGDSAAALAPRLCHPELLVPAAPVPPAGGSPPGRLSGFPDAASPAPGTESGRISVGPSPFGRNRLHLSRSRVHRGFPSSFIVTLSPTPWTRTGFAPECFALRGGDVPCSPPCPGFTEENCVALGTEAVRSGCPGRVLTPRARLAGGLRDNL